MKSFPGIHPGGALSACFFNDEKMRFLSCGRTCETIKITLVRSLWSYSAE